MHNDRRKYVRISTVLPIEFCILDENGKQITPWLQGFTHDISRGGLRLIVNDLWQGILEKLNHKNTKILLRINLFFNKKTITTTAVIVWTRQEKLQSFYRYHLGLEIINKNTKEVNELFSYALFNKFTPKLVTASIIILVIFSATLFLRAAMLTVENRNLVKKYVAILEKSSNLKAKGGNVTKEIAALDEERRKISKQIIDGVYLWIKNRQDLISGLVLSYEGDQSLKKTSFTYDQALAVIVFTIFKDNRRAEKILDFYLAKVNKGENICNAYYTQGDCAEYIVHSGPNAWLGLAVLDYYKATNNPKYLPIAEKVAGFLLSMMDSEGGIKGGPTVSWYATEHNLDAFAFFDSFYKITKNQKYLEARDKIKHWIEKYAYTTYGPPVQRGKGDSTIATDTYAWSIAAFGPEELSSMKMNPERIVDFAVQNCEAQVTFRRKEGEVQVKGFDFAKARNCARRGVVSCEWTAQMILSFEIMADYYKTSDINKYKYYLSQSIFYFTELQKMLITSPSKIGREDPCFPYASSASVDTGHGWRTPEGNTTGSLSSTAYFLIAYKGYNPLRGEYLNEVATFQASSGAR